MAAVLQCPDRAVLLRLFTLGGSADEIESLAIHVEQCARCGKTFDDFLQKDNAAPGLLQSRGAAASTDSPALKDLAARIARLRPVPAGVDQTGGADANDTGGSIPAAIPLEGSQADAAFLSPPQLPDEIGRLGTYRILKKLGAGGMGMVFLAEDTMLQRKVALKTMLPTIAVNPQARERFLREARAAAAIEHQHIIAIHQVGEDSGVPFLAMPLLKGESLEDRLARLKELPMNDAIRIAFEMADGLAAAHAQGLIHRDIKPGNVWLEDQLARGTAPGASASSRPSKVKLLDFGLARSRTEDVHLTQSGAIVGTPAFMAPEQARGEAIDGRADLFSLGCVLYVMLTGERPFRGSTTMALLTALALDTPKTPRELKPAVPALLSDFTMRLLAKNPDDRPASADAVLDELRNVVRAINDAKKAPPPMPASQVSKTIPPPLPARTMAPAVPITATVPKPHSVAPRKALRRNIIIVAVAFLVLFGSGIAAYQLIFKTKDGTLIVEVDGDADVRFQQGELRLFDADGKLKYTLKSSEKDKTLPPGKYAIEVAGADGLKVVTDKFEITKGNTTTVRVTAAAPQQHARKPDTPEWTTPPGELKNSLGMKFVRLPKGTFYMGGGDGVAGSKAEIKEDFEIAIYTVTQGQWQTLMNNNPSYFSREGGGKAQVMSISDADLLQFPVENVSWDDTQAFIKKLNEREKSSGLLYRLPTEAEWEYACRGGATSEADCSFHFYFDKPTNEISEQQANFNGNLNRPTKVGSYKPNQLGLYDMHGNVRQWCQDLYGPGNPNRVSRGGSWCSTAAVCRAKNRGNRDPQKDQPGIRGFRLVRVPSGGESVTEIKRVPPPKLGENSLGMKFVRLPKGTFYMGGGGGTAGKLTEIKEDFEIAIHTVTQGQWQALMGNNPSYFSREGVGKDKVKDIEDEELKQFPVEQVSWEDAQRFIEKLNEKEHASSWSYRLPTEAEWEYSCRGGATSEEECSYHYYFEKPTNEISRAQSNFNNSMGRTTKVDAYKPNKLGLFAMHGNVRQWCSGWFQEGSSQLIRGGSWYYNGSECRAAFRYKPEPAFRIRDVGFRVVRVPETRKTAPTKTDDADRRAAEWAVSNGLMGRLRIGNQERNFGELGKTVPNEPFQLTEISFERHQDKATDAGLAQFQGCKNLRKIKMWNGGDTFTAAGLAHFRDCKDLTELVLYSIPCTTDEGLANFRDCKELLHLDVSRARVTDAGLAYFKDCKKLTHLRLEMNERISNAGLAVFAECKGLVRLELQLNRQINDAGLTHFKDCKNLTFINLQATSVTDAGLAYFKDCKALKTMTLEGTQITDAGVPCLEGLTQLTKLDLRKTKVSAVGIDRLAKTLPACVIQRDDGIIKPKK